MIEALSPGLVALGLCLVIIPWLRRDSTVARSFLAAVSVLLLLHYWWWRVTETIPPMAWSADFVVGIVFIAAETAALFAGVLSLLFLSRTKERSTEVESRLGWFQPHAPLIDVFICTYNEEAAILERTIIGATGMRYPNYRVWVLDDGRRSWLQQLSARLGCNYLTRPDNRHAKAGNINHALRHVAALPEQPQFISILDADFVTTPDFLDRAMALFHDSDVGVVQTPQHFINPDPIQINLAATEVWPDEQRFFFDIVMPSKDAWGAAFCCGTSSVIRFAGLARIGGFPTDSVTEDYLLTLRLKEIGLRTVYLNERLTIGLAPEGLKEYITQRGRWCLGFMQIFRGRSGPFSTRSKLTFMDRLSLFEAFMGWSAAYFGKAFGLIVPPLYLLFGVQAVHSNLDDLLWNFMPFYLWHSLTIAWISHGRSLAIMADVAQLLALPAVCKAIVVGLLRPKGQKFKVTAKGGDRGRRFVEWPLLRFHAVMLAMTLAGIVYAFVLHLQGDSIAYGGLALAWSLYNAIILMIVCFVCIEQPRRRKSERFDRDEPVMISVDGASGLARLRDISLTGARFEANAPPLRGTRLQCLLMGQAISATVVRSTPGGFAVRFDEEIDTRVRMIRAFYAGDYVAGFTGIRALPVGRAIMARIFG
jgi:cellulose synthase (UDP-forming)